jgi:succinate-acetate transporter protein
MRALTKRRTIGAAGLAKVSLISLAAALALLAAGELVGSVLMLAVGGSIVVLTCVIAVPVIAAFAFTRPANH